MTVFGTGVRLLTRAFAIVAVSVLGACGSFYVDDTTHDLTAVERAPVATPKPVQLIFDFQTKGVSNTRARDLVSAQATTAVQDSGLFSTVSPDVQPDGAVVQVTINNVPLDDNAFAKGFMVGFTFGIVGTTVGDGYICTVDYLGGPNAARITKMERDAIYTSLGATASTPVHATKMKGLDEALHLMVHKCIGNSLNDLAKDPGFAK